MAIIANIRIQNWKAVGEYIRVASVMVHRAQEGWAIAYRIAVGEAVPEEMAEARCHFAWHQSETERAFRDASLQEGAEPFNKEAADLRWQDYKAEHLALHEQDFTDLGVELLTPFEPGGNALAAAYEHLKAQSFLSAVEDA